VVYISIEILDITIIQADALGLYAGRSWTPGLLESVSPFVIASEAKQSLLDPIRHTLNEK